MHETPYATDEGRPGSIFTVFGRLMCHHRLKLLCFRMCTINTLQVSDSYAVFLIFTAYDAFVAHKTAMWTDGKEAAAVSN